MNQSNRLILNATATYLRMAITIGMGLATTRMLLAGLGISDYGVLMAIIAGLSMLTVLNASLAISVQRHLAFEIGRTDFKAARSVFSSAMVLHGCLAVFIGTTGYLIRDVALAALTIPPDRLETARVVYHGCLLISFCTVAMNPFVAVFAARQRMVEEAFLALASSAGWLVVAWWLTTWSGDRLLFFIAGITISRLSILLVQIAWSAAVFEEARPRFRDVSWARIREAGVLMSWTTLASLSYRSRNEGVGVVLNIFFGPTVNAAYSVAIQCATYMTNLFGALIKAIQPVLAGMEARSDGERLKQVTLATSKFCFLMASFVAVPVLIVPLDLLRAWLGQPPPLAEFFTPLLIIAILVDVLTFGHDNAAIAKNRYGYMVRRTFGWGVASIVFGVAVFHFTSLPPASISVLAVIFALATTLTRVVAGEALLGISRLEWFRKVVLRVVFPVSAAAIVSGLVSLSPLTGGLRVIGVGLAYFLAGAPLMWWFALEAEERYLLLVFSRRGLDRVRRRAT